MNEPALVRAQWALLSKPPADTGDYRVLACSAGRSGFHAFERLVRDTLFGTPPQWSSSGRPGENLPWISFGVSGDGRSSARRVSVSVTDWRVGGADIWDSAGRRPVATRYFAVRYEDLARHGAGLAALWDAVLPVVLPPGPGDTDVPDELSLRIDTDPLPRLARLLDEDVDFGWAAATAAAALTGPLALVAHTSRYALTRIETMDAVAALLPYGCRAALTAATWAPDPTAYTPWLCYTHPADSPARLTVYEGVVPQVRGAAGRAHLDLLLRLRERSGTLACLRALAGAVEPAALPAGSGPTGEVG